MEVLPSRSVLSRSSSSGVHLFFWFVDTELLPLRLQPQLDQTADGVRAVFSIERAVAFVCEHWDFVTHFDKAHFDQDP
jgi:hypothetical protein